MNDAERKFSIELTEILPQQYDILKSKYKYARVDLIIINKNNLKSLYIEHKQRNIFSHNFKTIIIKYSKVKALIKDYHNVIFCCQCIDELLYIRLTEDILELDREDLENGENVIHIPITSFTKSIHTLKKDILQKLQ